MNRLITALIGMLLTATLLPLPAAGAEEEAMDPLLARQLMRIMTDADGDVAQMLTGLAELAQRKRRPKDLKFVMRERAALLIQEEQLDVAREELQATLAGQPEEYAPALRYLLGQIFLLQDDPEAALGPLQTWARFSPDADPWDKNRAATSTSSAHMPGNDLSSM